MKPFEQNAPTVGALLGSNSSPLERMRWVPRWATNRFAECWVVRAVFGGEPPPPKLMGHCSATTRMALQASSRAIQFWLIAGKYLV
jgi:hypothetical protein